MAGKKTKVELAGGYFSEMQPEQDIHPVQSVQDVQGVKLKKDGTPDKRFTRSIEHQTQRATVHVHTMLFSDDLDALKAIAWEKGVAEGRTIGVNEMLRDIVAEYVKKHRKA